MSKARNRVTGFHYLSDKPNDNVPIKEQIPPLYAPTHAEVSILKIVATAASNAELGAAYVNTKLGICERRTLEEMNHPQIAIKGTPIEINNSTTYGTIHEYINQKRFKAIDMRYYWLRD